VFLCLVCMVNISRSFYFCCILIVDICTGLYRSIGERYRHKVEEVCIILEEDLHSINLQKHATQFDMVVQEEEEYIAREDQVRTQLQ
jgi:hypothetical protein